MSLNCDDNQMFQENVMADDGVSTVRGKHFSKRSYGNSGEDKAARAARWGSGWKSLPGGVRVGKA